MRLLSKYDEFADPALIVESRQNDCGYKVRSAMTIDESKQVGELLAAWYAWQDSFVPALGVGRVAASCRGFSEDHRFDDIEDRITASERRAKKLEAEQIDVCVSQLSFVHQRAIQQHFGDKKVAVANKEDGASVWRNARKFDFNSGPHVAFRQAKFALLPALKARGMIKAEVFA